MDQSYISGLELGRRPPPRDRQLLRLANALTATPDETLKLRYARAVTQLARSAKTWKNFNETALETFLQQIAGAINEEEISIVEAVATAIRLPSPQHSTSDTPLMTP